MHNKTIYAGTYTEQNSQGIYKFTYEDGKISDPELFCVISNPKYLCRYQDKMLSICDTPAGSGIALIDNEGKILDTCVYENKSSCFVAAFGERIYTANYHEGTVSLLKIEEGKIRLIRKATVREKAGCHQILSYQDMILVPCLFEDKIMIYDQELNPLRNIDFPKGSGPRHGLFIDEYLYVASELSNELFVIDMRTEKIVNQIGLLDKIDVTGTAAIRRNRDHLYVSTRGVDVISSVSFDKEELHLEEVVDCGGKHPRDFIIIDDHLLCANRFSDNVIVFSLNEDGNIGNKTSELEVPEAVCLLEV